MVFKKSGKLSFMKISNVCNGTLTIQANPNKAGDFRRAQLVALQMVEESGREIVLCAECDFEKWIQVSSKWDYKQADELKLAYKDAKKTIINR